MGQMPSHFPSLSSYTVGESPSVCCMATSLKYYTTWQHLKHISRAHLRCTLSDEHITSTGKLCSLDCHPYSND